MELGDGRTWWDIQTQQQVELKPLGLVCCDLYILKLLFRLNLISFLFRSRVYGASDDLFICRVTFYRKLAQIKSWTRYFLRFLEQHKQLIIAWGQDLKHSLAFLFYAKLMGKVSKAIKK